MSLLSRLRHARPAQQPSGPAPPPPPPPPNSRVPPKRREGHDHIMCDDLASHTRLPCPLARPRCASARGAVSSSTTSRDHRETRGKSERQGLGLTGRKSKSLTSSVRRRADLPLQRPWSCPPSDISPLYNAPYRTGTVPSSPRISLHFQCFETSSLHYLLLPLTITDNVSTVHHYPPCTITLVLHHILPDLPRHVFTTPSGTPGQQTP